jgi:hypothetical protein
MCGRLPAFRNYEENALGYARNQGAAFSFHDR